MPRAKAKTTTSPRSAPQLRLIVSKPPRVPKDETTRAMFKFCDARRRYRRCRGWFDAPGPSPVNEEAAANHFRSARADYADAARSLARVGRQEDDDFTGQLVLMILRAAQDDAFSWREARKLVLRAYDGAGEHGGPDGEAA